MWYFCSFESCENIRNTKCPISTYLAKKNNSCMLHMPIFTSHGTNFHCNKNPDKKKHKCIEVYWINVLHWQILLYIININYSAFFPLGHRYFICNILRDFFIDLENLWISKFWLCRCSFLESFFCIIMRNIYWYLSIIHLFIPHLDFQVFTWKIFFSFWQNHIHSDKHSSLLETSPLHSYEGSFVELV